VLHFIGEEDDPYAIVARLMDAVPSGSYLAIRARSERHQVSGYAGRIPDLQRTFAGSAHAADSAAD
jgi:hypothetical protein